MRASSAARAGVGTRRSGNEARESLGDGVSHDMRRSSESGASALRGQRSSRKVAMSLMREGGIGKMKSILIEKSLYVLPVHNPLRNFAIRVVYHRHFDKVIMGLIGLNCVFLAMDSKAPGFEDTTRGELIALAEPIFLALFCLEMSLKILACGFFGHENAYLSDGWNRLDFFVVILGVLAALDLGNFSAIRVVRVLRPLRTIQGFAGMRRLIETLLKSMPLLFDVTVLVSFLFFIFGLVGVQLFGGAFTHRCATVSNAPSDCVLCGVAGAIDSSTGCDVGACTSWNTDNDTWIPAWHATTDDVTCGGPTTGKWPVVDTYTPAGYKCPSFEEGSFCATGFANPNYGITNFDNVLNAWLTIFQCISLEGWTDVMYLAKDAVSPWAWIYFVVMIILGSFFAVNLALAVLFVSFVDGGRAARDEEVETADRTFLEGGGPDEPSGTDVALLNGEDQTEEEYQALKLLELGARLEQAGTHTDGGEMGTPRVGRAAVVESVAEAVVESVASATGGNSTSPTTPSVTSPSNMGSLQFRSAKVTPVKTPLRQDASPAAAVTGGRKPWLDEGFGDIQTWVKSKGAEVEDISVDPVNGQIRVVTPSAQTKAQRFCRRLATSTRAANLTMFLIVANTALMASEFHGMPATMKLAYETLNLAITVYFGVEMGVKLVGLTPKGYVADKFNVFDGVVVVVSFAELLITSVTGDGGGMLSALRTGRLLRVFKLARSWPQLRNIITTILSTIPSMSSLAGMLLLFIFIFDLLGMQLFGYKFLFCDSYDVAGASPTCPPGYTEQCPVRNECYTTCTSEMANQWVTFNAETGAAGKCVGFSNADDAENVTYLARLGAADRPRHHFDDFFWSFITIFQVLTGEDWNAVMFDAMRTVGPWASVYFIAIVVIGNYVVLNLFLAILLDNFSNLAQAGAGDETDGKPSEKHRRLVKEKRIENETKARETRRVQHAAREKKEGLEKAAAGSDEADARRAVRKLLFSKNRKKLEWFVTHRRFDAFILAMIVASSVVLAIDAPAEVAQNSQMKYWLDFFDLLFVLVFACEALLKMCALGKRYFKFGWNLLDFCIVSVGVAAAVIQSLASADDANAVMAAKLLRATRALRYGLARFPNPGTYVLPLTLVTVRTDYGDCCPYIVQFTPNTGLTLFVFTIRPLRIANRSAGMKVVISALFAAAPAIANVGLVCALFYLIFGILGLNLFMGKMYRCVDTFDDQNPLDPTALGLVDGEITKAWCLSGPRLTACVDDRVVAVFSGGDGYADGGYGWQCLRTAAVTAVSTDGSYSSYGGEWACVASDLTRRVLNGTDTSTAPGSVFSQGAASLSVAVAAAYTAAVTTGTLVSTCEPSLLHPQWKLPRNYDFDHIGTSMLVLFETATLEMWLEVMYHGVDAVGEDIHPQRDANPGACVFFVIFIIVGSFFIMNLFVGVTIDKFNEMKEESAAEYEAELNAIKGEGGFGRDRDKKQGALVNDGKRYAEKMAAPVLARTNSKRPERKSSLRRSSLRRQASLTGHNLAHKTAHGGPMGAVGAVFVTEEQRRWQQVEKMLMQCKPRRALDPPPRGSWRVSFFRFTNNNTFDGVIGVCITLNVMVMCLTYAGESDQWALGLWYTNAAFALVFLVEACLKLVGFGVLQYFGDHWNRFDFLVVSFSVAGFVMDTVTSTDSANLSILRLFRVVRVLRLVKRAKGLQTLLQTLLFSLPALFNVGSVLFLFFFIYSVMGMNLFGVVRDGEVLGRHANFKNFPEAMAALFRSATGERWNGIMHDCMVSTSCVEILNADDAGTYAAGTWVDYKALPDLKNAGLRASELDFVDRCTPNIGITVFYFVSFILLCGFVMLNLVIAVILDNFESYSKNFALPVSDEDFYEFTEEWSRIDRRATYYINVKELPLLLKRIRAPLGLRTIPKQLQKDALRRTLYTCDVEIRDGNRVHFVDVLKHLAARVDGVEDPDALGRSKSGGFTDSFSGVSNTSATQRSDSEKSNSSKSNKVHPAPDASSPKSLTKSGAATFRWRSDRKKNSLPEDEDWDDDNDDDSVPNVVPQVCHNFAAIHVQTMWKGKLARRQAELRKLKKKKRSMRRRKADENEKGGAKRAGGSASGDDESSSYEDENGSP